MWREVVTDVGDEEDSDTNVGDGVDSDTDVGHEEEDSDTGSIVELAPLLKRMLPPRCS